MKKRIVSILLSLLLVLNFCAFLGNDAYAATAYTKTVSVGDTTDIELSFPRNYSISLNSDNTEVAYATVVGTSMSIINGTVKYSKTIRVKGMKAGDTVISVTSGASTLATINVNVEPITKDLSAHINETYLLTINSGYDEDIITDTENVSCDIVSKSKQTSTTTINGSSFSEVTYIYGVKLKFLEKGIQEFLVSGTSTGDIYKVRADVSDHNWNESFTVQKEPSCIEQGTKSIHCKICNAIKPNSEEIIAPKGHDYSDKKIINDANCTTSGQWQQVCKTCNDKKTGTIDAKGHAWNKEFTIDKKPTCTEKGEKSIHCKMCGEIKDTEVIPAKGHTDIKVSAKDATCTEIGYKEGVECIVCGERRQEKIEKIDHVFNSTYTVDKEATYGDAGMKSIHCSMCGKIKKGTEVEIPKLVCKIAAPTKISTSLTSYYGSTAGYDDLKITWDKVEGADGYYIRYKSQSSSTWHWATSTTKNYKYLKNLTDGKRYYIRVYPYVKEDGKKYKSTKYKSTTSVYTLKKVSTPTVSKSSRNYVKVKWRGISGETGYQIYRATSKNGKYSKVASVKMSTYKYPYAKIKTTKNKTYYYKVRAYKSIGNGKYVYGPFSSVKSYKLK